MSETNVILIGASTRAAAMSALRAGWTPWCADLFADADLQRIATVRKVSAETYPQGLIDALADASRAPVIYTGALENRPDLIAQIDRPLWGNSPDVLRAIRSPSRWTQCLQARGLPFPAIAEVPTSGRWLLKPRKGASGFGIQDYSGQSFKRRTHFLQEYIDGVPCSAIFLAHETSAILLGVTQQLIGTPWLNTSGFHYGGNVGPLALDAAVAARWHAIGSALAETFHLRGLFGVDAILRDGVPWPVEINPRYTASVEILERCYRTPMLTLHCDAFTGRTVPKLNLANQTATCGKAILFARETFAFPERGPWLAVLGDGIDFEHAEYADIPHAGEVIEKSRPVLTLFVSGTTAAEVLVKLQEKVEALDRRLWG